MEPVSGVGRRSATPTQPAEKQAQAEDQPGAGLAAHIMSSISSMRDPATQQDTNASLFNTIKAGVLWVASWFQEPQEDETPLASEVASPAVAASDEGGDDTVVPILRKTGEILKHMALEAEGPRAHSRVSDGSDAPVEEALPKETEATGEPVAVDGRSSRASAVAVEETLGLQGVPSNQSDVLEPAALATAGSQGPERPGSTSSETSLH